MSALATILRIHEAIYKGTGGLIGHRMIGVPTLLLHTTGRRSGQPRSNALVYARDGHDYLVVASNGGSDRDPGWLHNLKAAPHVEIQIARRRLTATARVVEPADPDYGRLWKIVNANNGDRYTAYQKRTDRLIPVVVLSPG